MTLEDVYILITPLDTWSMDDMERQRRARYQKSRGEMSILVRSYTRNLSNAHGTTSRYPPTCDGTLQNL